MKQTCERGWPLMEPASCVLSATHPSQSAVGAEEVCDGRRRVLRSVLGRHGLGCPRVTLRFLFDPGTAFHYSAKEGVGWYVQFWPSAFPLRSSAPRRPGTASIAGAGWRSEASPTRSS